MSKKKSLKFILLSILLTVIDQLSKFIFISLLEKRPISKCIIKLLPILDIVYIWNHGIGFGLFHRYQQYSNIIFLLINSVIILYLSYLSTMSNTYLSFIGFSMTIGGALGNLIDRIFRGSVFDFIYFHYKDLSLPVFNFADSFIIIGAFILIWECHIIPKND